MNNIYYKIRRKSDGLFNNGSGRFTKQGKVWKRVGDLHSHITNNRHSYESKNLNDLEVVSYEVVEVDTEPLQDRVAQAKFNRRQRELKDRIGHLKYQIKKNQGDEVNNKIELHVIEQRLEKLYNEN